MLGFFTVVFFPMQHKCFKCRYMQGNLDMVRNLQCFIRIFAYIMEGDVAESLRR